MFDVLRFSRNDVIVLLRFMTLAQELVQESESKGGKTSGNIDDITWTLPHLEAAVLQSISRTPAKNPATNATWPPIKSLEDVLKCR
jgi:hypothetical protein